MEANQDKIKFLETLSETEKAFFAKYKLPTYLRSSQKEVKAYLKAQGLTRTKVDSIIRENAFMSGGDTNQCLRCGSIKLYEVQVGKKSCLVCGFEKDKKKGRLFSFSFLRWPQ
jgi:ribosomal protein L37E